MTQCVYSFCTNNLHLYIKIGVSSFFFPSAAQRMKLKTSSAAQKGPRERKHKGSGHCHCVLPVVLPHYIIWSSFLSHTRHDAFSMPPDVSECGMAARGPEGIPRGEIRGPTRCHFNITLTRPPADAKALVLGAKV